MDTRSAETVKGSFWSIPEHQLQEALGSGNTGLSDEEAARRHPERHPVRGDGIRRCSNPVVLRLFELFFAAMLIMAASTFYRSGLINPPRLVHGEPHLQSAAQAQRYLTEIARRSFPPEVQVRTHVHLKSTNNVASRVCIRTHLPCLLVPVADKESRDWL